MYLKSFLKDRDLDKPFIGNQKTFNNRNYFLTCSKAKFNYKFTKFRCNKGT